MREFSSYSDSTNKLYGKYQAEVINDTDPKGRDRIQVNIFGITDKVDDKTHYPWAEQQGAISRGTKSTNGSSIVPSKGEYVYIEFLHGNPNYPIYVGMVRGGSDSSNSNPSISSIKTPEGHLIEYGGAGIKLVHNDGTKVEITPTKIELNTGSASIIIDGDTITFTGSSTEINTTTLNHNGTDIGELHTHSGVTAGSSDTGVPN